MKNKLGEAFASRGLFLDQKISLYFALQKGRENEKKLGSFRLDVEGCGNIARKIAFIVILVSFFVCGIESLKKEKIF